MPGDWIEIVGVLDDFALLDARNHAIDLWKSFETRTTGESGSHGRLRRVHLISRQMRELIIQPAIWTPVERLLAGRCSLCSLVISVKGNRVTPHKLHKDSTFIGVEDDGCASMLLALSDIGEANGGIYFLTQNKRVFPTLNAGSAIIWKGGELHGSVDNTTHQPRLALIAHWVLSDRASGLASRHRPILEKDGQIR